MKAKPAELTSYLAHMLAQYFILYLAFESLVFLRAYNMKNVLFYLKIL